MKSKIIYWVLTILVALPFTMFGAMKIFAVQDMLNNMSAINYNATATFLIGLVEIIAVIGLFTKWRVYALGVLLLILAGATGSHIGGGQGIGSVVIPVTIAIITGTALLVTLNFQQWKLNKA